MEHADLAWQHAPIMEKCQEVKKQCENVCDEVERVCDEVAWNTWTSIGDRTEQENMASLLWCVKIKLALHRMRGDSPDKSAYVEIFRTIDQHMPDCEAKKTKQLFRDHWILTVMLDHAWNATVPSPTLQQLMRTIKEDVMVLCAEREEALTVISQLGLSARKMLDWVEDLQKT